MEILELAGKMHDESRQGEAYDPVMATDNSYQKRFYIESYGCAMNLPKVLALPVTRKMQH